MKENVIALCVAWNEDMPGSRLQFRYQT